MDSMLLNYVVELYHADDNDNGRDVLEWCHLHLSSLASSIEQITESSKDGNREESLE